MAGRKLRGWALVTALFALTLTGCDDLTERDEKVSIGLDSFNLIGSSGKRTILATVTGNPACTAGQTSVNSLLAQVDNYDDFDEFLESLRINEVRYRIPVNNTPVEISASMSMTDPATGQLTTIAEISIPANTTVDSFTTFPWTEGGRAVAQHYMDNLNATFLYCAQGSPGSADLNLTLDLQLDTTVTIDLL